MARKKSAEREIQMKIEDLLHALNMRQGDFGRTAIFRAAKYGDKYTVITRTSVGRINTKTYLYFVDNNTGDVHAPVYAYGDRYRPSDEATDTVDDLIAQVSGS